MKVDFAQLYVKGARVWIADKELVWRGAKLAEDLDQEKTQIRLLPDDENISGSGLFSFLRTFDGFLSSAPIFKTLRNMLETT